MAEYVNLLSDNSINYFLHFSHRVPFSIDFQRRVLNKTIGLTNDVNKGEESIDVEHDKIEDAMENTTNNN